MEITPKIDCVDQKSIRLLMVNHILELTPRIIENLKSHDYQVTEINKEYIVI